MRTREEITKDAQWRPGDSYHFSQAPDANTNISWAILGVQLDIRDQLALISEDLAQACVYLNRIAK